MKIVVKVNTDNVDVDIDKTKNILHIKEKLQEKNEEYKVENTRLIFMGRLLKNDTLISECKIKENSRLHAVVKIPEKQPSPPPPSNQEDNNSFNMFGDTGENSVDDYLTSSIGRQTGSFINNSTEEQMMNYSTEGQMMNNSTDEQMMNNPTILNMLNSLFSNPQMLQKFMDVNRRLESGELAYESLSQDPVYQEIMSDSSIGQNFNQILSDPNIMQTMMNEMIGGGGEESNYEENTQQEFNDELSIDQLINLPVDESNTEENKEKYKEQLEQLLNFGFTDEEKNLRLLVACQGNLQIVMNRLLD